MRKFLVVALFWSSLSFVSAQENSSFQAGEWLKFKLSYSGWMKAGNATLEIHDAQYKDKPVFHVIGKGWTTGAIKWFFKVKTAMRVILIKKLASPINLFEMYMKEDIPKIEL